MEQAVEGKGDSRDYLEVEEGARWGESDDDTGDSFVGEKVVV